MRMEAGQHLVDWVRANHTYSPFPDARAVGVVDRHDRIRAAALYDVFEPATCRMHIFSDGSRAWLNREALYTAFSYPFLQCGLRRVTGLIASRNTPSLSLARRLGFRDEGVCPNSLPDDDVIVLGMLREHCRFLSGPYLKEMERKHV